MNVCGIWRIYMWMGRRIVLHLAASSRSLYIAPLVCIKSSGPTENSCWSLYRIQRLAAAHSIGLDVCIDSINGDGSYDETIISGYLCASRTRACSEVVAPALVQAQ
ncbi:f06844ec-685c-485f-a43a-65b438b2888b [Sclerotinia trifoliorum]|uniref:F06844ec-685c-485f-a43a-65b438b2888b n=1 Tax=Sclerotinia trifoliorum TaxID=28548 RepID=A0A8H2VSL8_9HELO|nr:f06844ec-685c-485f-a43a-65b438b2888b [Sclerotinia trifoliorum]